MELLLSYIMKSALILTVVCLLFLWLKNDRNFTRNRVFLLSGLILSIVLPLISFTIPQASVATKVVTLQPVLINATEINTAIHQNLDFFSILLIIYLTGVFILLIRSGIQIFKLFRIAKRSVITRKAGYRLIKTIETGSPFSFFNMVFMNEKMSEEEAETILAHELAHVNQHHSLDVLLMEGITILQWFNPAVWYYRTLLRQEHEYLADRATLNKGVEKAGYFQLLFAMALKVQPIDITNNFCQIKLKRRLTMITKKSNSRFAGVKFVLMTVVLAVFTGLVACNNADRVNKETTPEVAPPPPPPPTTPTEDKATVPPSTTNGGNDVYTVVENMPEYPGGDEARVKFITGNIKYPSEAKEKGIMGTVYVSFVVEKDGRVTEVKVIRGIGGGCDEEALRVVKMMPRWKPGTQSGKAVRVQFNLPVKFLLS